MTTQGAGTGQSGSYEQVTPAEIAAGTPAGNVPTNGGEPQTAGVAPDPAAALHSTYQKQIALKDKELEAKDTELLRVRTELERTVAEKSSINDNFRRAQEIAGLGDDESAKLNYYAAEDRKIQEGTQRLGREMHEWTAQRLSKEYDIPEADLRQYTDPYQMETYALKQHITRTQSEATRVANASQPQVAAELGQQIIQPGYDRGSGGGTASTSAGPPAGLKGQALTEWAWKNRQYTSSGPA